ncbi:MAG TPA: metallophosphoesterase family protein [Streptosporangiaceae bacterium]|nr:metallophosphoesterase family protein [Streptosporangiaceae bacterium]
MPRMLARLGPEVSEVPFGGNGPIFLTRRSLLRGGAIGAGVALGGPALLITGSAAASTAPRSRKTPALITKSDSAPGSSLAPFGRHIAFGADPTTSMSVAWQTAGPVSNPFIRLGQSPSGLGNQIGAEVRNLATPASVWNTVSNSPVDSVPPSLANSTIEQYYLHAVLTGLQPGQTYYYSVGHQGWDSGDVSGSFTTAPGGRQPFRFTAFGDQGSTYDAIGTTTLIRSQNPDLHLHAGDISYAESGGSGLLTDGCRVPGRLHH